MFAHVRLHKVVDSKLLCIYEPGFLFRLKYKIRIRGYTERFQGKE